jgi:hypothetical protein
MSDPFKTYGPPEFCTWRYGPGTCRFQTTSPRIARKLSQRHGASLVAWSVTNQYLRIFQEEIEPWRARLLVTRYLNLKPTNGAFLSDIRRRSCENGPVESALPVAEEPLVGQLRSQNPPVFTTRGDLVSESKAQGRVRL